MIIHTVRPNETIYTIARNYGVPPARIIADNALEDPNELAVGQTLVILYHNQAYVVREGDTLESIAGMYGVSVNQLLRNNPYLKGNYQIVPGQTIVISYRNQPLSGTYSVNGYAYPFIDRAVLRQTLPYLTYLTLFSYGFTSEGELVTIDDEELISLAREYGVAPIMLLSTISDEGTFSNELASEIINNTELQDTVINNVLNVMREKNYYGLDIDFEYVFPQDREAYAAFIAKFEEALDAENYILVTSLAPKTSDDQRGLLYEAHDYQAIGSASDYVLLMTYEWGYTYGPPCETQRPR